MASAVARKLDVALKHHEQIFDRCHWPSFESEVGTTSVACCWLAGLVSFVEDRQVLHRSKPMTFVTASIRAAGVDDSERFAPVA